ncbi:MAG: hypothetical protein JXM69_08150 [Anaerolineae bacterium]|nr:hypothetical protein [Anaerolineae bacterium]
MNQILHQPGFLGTNANFAADMTLTLSVMVAILFTGGVGLAVKGYYQAHRWTQTTAAALNAILILWLMILPFRDFIIKDFMGPRPAIFYYVTSAHAVAGFCGLILGLFVVLRANNFILIPKALRFNNYKLFMRISYALYMLATLLGIWVYLTWFVSIPNPPTF